MNPALLIPLSGLPAPVPAGTPGILDGDVPVFILDMHDDETYSIIHPDWMFFPPPTAARLSADLSPPPLDSAGHPTRIDALPVLVDMLARAMGHPEGWHTLTPSTVTGWWNLSSYTDGPIRRMISTIRSDDTSWTRSDDGYARAVPSVPALASINLTSPLAPRLALVALFAARVWETPS